MGDNGFVPMFHNYDTFYLIWNFFRFPGFLVFSYKLFEDWLHVEY